MTTVFKKREHLTDLVARHRLYPSRKGILHSVKGFRKSGDYLSITMDCEVAVRVRDSRRGRATRLLKCMAYKKICGRCRMPQPLATATPAFEREPGFEQLRSSRRKRRIWE